MVIGKPNNMILLLQCCYCLC